MINSERTALICGFQREELMKYWRNMFSQRILERGESYYYGDLVETLEKTEDGYIAIVNGTDDYEVEIIMDGDEIDDMTCTCPYAEDGHNCRHMAAVLTAIENGEAVGINDQSGPRESIEEILEQMSEDQLRSELKQAVYAHSDIRDRICGVYRTKEAGEADVMDVYYKLNSLAVTCGDRYGFVDWRSGPEYVREFSECMENLIRPMIERGEYMIAFRSLAKAFDVLNEVDMDGSGGEHSDIASMIEGYWDEVIHGACEEERGRMHDWFVSKQDYYMDQICGDSIDYVLEHSFDDTKYLEPLLEEVRRNLEEPDLNLYRERDLLEKYREYLCRIGENTEEYEKWLESHESHPAVMEIRLKQAEERKDTETAVRILEELCGKTEYDREKYGYRIRLLKLYEKSGQKEKEKQMLRYFLADQNDTSRERIGRYRDLCGKEEWDEFRDAYLEKHPSLKPEIYHEEKLYDRLLDCLSGQPVNVIDRYRDELKDAYPQELLAIYMGYLYTLERRHPNNSTYQEMRRYLLIAAAIDGGKKESVSLIREWIGRYPTRTAMQRMLSEVIAEIS